MESHVPYSSDQKVQQYFETIRLPYLDFLNLGGGISLAKVVKHAVQYGIATKDFANNNFLAGKHIVHLKTILRDPSSTPAMLAETIAIAREHSKASNAFATVNIRIGQGYYVQEPKVVDPKSLADQSLDFIQRVSGACKEVVASIIPTNTGNGIVYALADGYSNTLKNVIKLGNLRKIKKYINVELSELKIEAMKRSPHWKEAGNMADVILGDINEVPIAPGSHVIINNAAHFLKRPALSKILEEHTCDGIYMAADLIFDIDQKSHIVAPGFDLTYDPVVDRCYGSISGLKIRERPLLTIDFPHSYPLKFMKPPKDRDKYHHPFFRSFAFFSNINFRDVSDKLPGKLGPPIRLIDAGFKASFGKKRPLMRRLSQNDYDWLMVTGGYLSAKLNGVPAFCHANNSGVWKLTLRGGLTFICRMDCIDDTDRPFVFSNDSTDQFYVELVKVGKYIYPFFLATLNGVNDLVSYSAKIKFVQSKTSMLSFKSYHPLKAKSESLRLDLIQLADSRLIEVPTDGMVIADIYGNATFYFKPLPTYDLLIHRRSDGTIGAADGRAVDDPRKKFAQDGMYECMISNGSLVLGCFRPDKFIPNDPLDIDPTPDMFEISQWDHTKMVFDIMGNHVYMPKLTPRNFVRGDVTAPYEAVMDVVTSAGMDPDATIKLSRQLIDKIRFFPKDLKGIFNKATDVIKILSMVKPDISVQYTWAHLHKIGILSDAFTRMGVALFPNESGYAPSVVVRTAQCDPMPAHNEGGGEFSNYPAID